MWRVYKHTGKDKDYEAYKEPINAATNEVQKSKRNFGYKLLNQTVGFSMRLGSKQNVRDKVGPMEDNVGNKITQGFLMAEELNLHFSSVFTREDISSLPVPETKLNGPEEERLGQLVVTPELVASKINNMKENKSPGVDGISPYSVLYVVCYVLRSPLRSMRELIPGYVNCVTPFDFTVTGKLALIIIIDCISHPVLEEP